MDRYKVPEGETFNDFVIYMELVFAQLKSVNSDENYLIEIYAIQILIQYFIEKDDE